MKIAFIAPDYGSQFVGMAKELYDQSRVMQEYFEEASICLDTNFVKLCFASSEAELNQISVGYPALFLVSAAIGAMLREKGIIPTLVAGLGIGEFSAACIARSLSLPDGLYLLSKYAQFYQEFLDGNQIECVKIMTNGIDAAKKLIEKSNTYLSIVYNDTDVFVAGPAKQIDSIKGTLDEQNLTYFMESPAQGIHCALMEPVLQQLRVYLEKIDFKDSEISVITSVDGNFANQGGQIQAAVMAQLKSTVHWNLVMKQIALHADIVVEMGPGIGLSELFKREYPQFRVFNINKPTDVDELLAIINSQSK
jgi:[acyl-carrier-protein] S-malonyltransferase